MNLPATPRSALAVAGVGAAVTVILAAVAVPWQWSPDLHSWSAPLSDFFDAQRLEQIRAFAGRQRALGLASMAVSLLVLSLIGFSGRGARWLARVNWPWPVVVAIGCSGALLAASLATLGLDWWRYRNALGVGLTQQSWAAWLWDQGLGWATQSVMVSLVAIVIVGFAKHTRGWVAWVAATMAVLTVGLSWVFPVVVEPLFNNFKSLPAGPLRDSVFELADREGVQISDVLVADASRRTTALNAYVSGLGATRRVVLYDTLVRGLPSDQAEVVIAHELAHAKHRDVLLGTSLAAVGSICGVGLIGAILGSARVRRRLAIDGPADPRSAAALVALFSIGSLLVSPLSGLASRAIEARADVTAVQTTRDVASAQRLQVTLVERAWGDPNPPAWRQFWFGTHPTTIQRIGLAEVVPGGKARVTSAKAPADHP